MNISIENVFKNIMNSMFVPLDKDDREMFAGAETAALINTVETQTEFVILKDGSRFEIYFFDEEIGCDIIVRVETKHYQTTLFPMKSDGDGGVKVKSFSKGWIWEVKMEVDGPKHFTEDATFFVDEKEG